MRKYPFPMTAALAALAFGYDPAGALMIAIRPASQRAVTAEVVVVGKVTAIEKNPVDALPPYPGAKEKVAYTVAVVKIDSALSGAANLTHIKIGVPVPQNVPPGGLVPVQAGGLRPIRPAVALELKEGQEMLFFLAKHPSADFYVIPSMSAPVDLKSDAGKKELEAVQKVTAVLADPMKGLKSDRGDVRVLAAATMILKYRSGPDAGGEVDQVAIAADESKLILKVLAEADWSNKVRPGADYMFNPLNAFHQLRLADKDGWKPPAFPRPAPGQPPVDFNALTKEAFVTWLAGPGRDYRIMKFVPKK